MSALLIDMTQIQEGQTLQICWNVLIQVQNYKVLNWCGLIGMSLHISGMDCHHACGGSRGTGTLTCTTFCSCISWCVSFHAQQVV